MAGDPVDRNFKILAFAFEKVGLPSLAEPIEHRNFTIFFEKYGSSRRFHEFDGVVLFKGIFEQFEKQGNWDGSTHYKCDYDRDELDKRKKETDLLLEKRGFVCYLLSTAFMDGKNDEWRTTDLAKYELSYKDLERLNFSSRVANMVVERPEFERFLKNFGAAWSYFRWSNQDFDVVPIATIGARPVGLVIGRAEYFVPTLVPDRRDEVLREYLTLLLDAITSTHTKIGIEVPTWVDEYRFDEEAGLLQKREALAAEVARTDQRIALLRKYKASLVRTSPELVTVVKAILEATLQMKVNTDDKLREDFKILAENETVVAIGEIKGVNRGIGRAEINQVDSHRERSGYAAEFPAILVANTGIKSARTVGEKREAPVAAEQIEHATKMRILVLRTIDLLDMLRLVLSGKLSADAARCYLLGEHGWLHVDGDKVVIEKGGTPILTKTVAR